MSKIGNIDIGSIYVGSLPIQAVYIGPILVWEESTIISGAACFSCGCWKDTLPWIDTEVWVDNTI